MPRMPPLVSTCVLVESLRSLAGRGSAVDAIVVAMAEPGGTVLTGDVGDLGALAAHAVDVAIEAVGD